MGAKTTFSGKGDDAFGYYTERISHGFALPFRFSRPESADGSSFRAEVSTNMAGPAFLGEITSDAYTAILPENHQCEEQVSIVFATGGRRSVAQDGRWGTFAAGDTVLFNNARQARWYFETPFAQTVLRLPKSLLDSYFLSDRFTAVRIPSTPSLGLVASLVRAACSGTGLPAAMAPALDRLGETLAGLVGAALSESLGQAGSRRTDRGALLTYVQGWILPRIGDPLLCAETIAQGCRMSLRSLHSLFADSGSSVMEWVWEARLAHARELLTQGSGLPVAAIACRCGFKSPAHFAARYKKRYGMTPTESARLR